MPGPSERPSWRQRPEVLLAAVGLVVVCWIVGNPRSSGPDEPSHMVAAAGLVRGDREGQPNPDPTAPGTHLFEVPGMVGAPDPGCWAQVDTLRADIPVGCANATALTTDTQLKTSSSYNYPPWALLLPGLASFSPSAGAYAYLARALSAAIPAVLVALSLLVLARRRSVDAAAALLGLTPIAWFTFGVVNPSAVAIGGGLALWTGLLSDRSRLTDGLAFAGWAAVLTSRRDGPVWATLIVLVVCLLLERGPVQLWREMRPSVRWASIAVVPVPVLTPLLNGERGFNLVLTFAPLSLLGAQLLAHRWERTPTKAGRLALLAGTAGAALFVASVLTTQRPGGFRAETLRLVISNTGRHMRQLVGVLGWLSTPVPSLAVYLFWAVIGGLVMLAALEFRKASTTYLTALGLAIVVAWLLELGQGANYGEYWHGRYTMPLAVGLPLVLVWRSRRAGELVERTPAILGWSAFLIANTAFVAAQQRWGVGINGSWYPWDWDTWGAPVPPLALIVIHAAATYALTATCLGLDRRAATGETRAIG